MARSDIKAGAAFIELYVKNSALVKGLNAAKERLHSFGRNVMAVGGFFTAMGTSILTPLAAAVTMFVATGSALAEMSARTGVAAGALAEYGFAAEQTGSSLDGVEKAIRFMQKSGAKETFDQAAQRIGAIADPAERTAAAIETFGRAGAELIPMLGNLQALRQEARDLNLVPSEEAVQSADEIGDAFDKIKSAVLASVFEIGAAIGPALLPALNSFTKIVASVTQWVRENGALVRTIALVGAGILAAGVAITAIGGGIFALGTVLGAAATVLTTLGAAVGLLISPVGITVGLLAAGAFAWLKFTESGRASVAYLMDLFGELATIAKDTFGGIADALAAGDLALAGEVAWAGLKVLWHKGTQDINKLWLDAKWYFLAVWQEATTGIAKYFTSAWASIQRGWTTTVAALKTIWTGFTTELGNGWNRAQKSAGNLLIDAAEKAGFVTKDFADTWREELDRPLDQQIKERTFRGAAAMADISAGESADLAKINAAEADALKNLEEDKARAYESLNADYQRDLDDKQKALDEARAALVGARGRAAEAASRAASADPKALPEIAAAELAKAVATVTFSGAGLLAVGQGGGPQQAVVRELVKNRELQRQELENDERMIRELEKGRPRFK